MRVSCFSSCAHVYTLAHSIPSQSSSSSASCDNARRCRFPSTHCCAVHPALIQTMSHCPAHTGRCRLAPHGSSCSETKCCRRFFSPWALSPSRFGTSCSCAVHSTMVLHRRCSSRHEFVTRPVRAITALRRQCWLSEGHVTVCARTDVETKLLRRSRCEHSHKFTKFAFTEEENELQRAFIHCIYRNRQLSRQICPATTAQFEFECTSSYSNNNQDHLYTLLPLSP